MCDLAVSYLEQEYQVTMYVVREDENEILIGINEKKLPDPKQYFKNIEGIDGSKIIFEYCEPYQF